MSGVAQYRQGGPDTYVPADNATIRGGDIVEAVAGGRIQRAGVGSTKALGAALTDAIAPEDVSTGTSNDALGRPVAVMVPIPTTVAVAYGPTTVKLTYAANAAFGDYLACAANGTVTPIAADGDPRLIVARCVEPQGVTVATNPRGLSRLLV